MAAPIAGQLGQGWGEARCVPLEFTLMRVETPSGSEGAG